MDRKFVIFIVISIGIIAFSNYFMMKNTKNRIKSAQIESTKVVKTPQETRRDIVEIAPKVEKREEKSIEILKKEELNTKYVQISAVSMGGRISNIRIERQKNKKEVSELITQLDERNHFAMRAKVNGTDLELDQKSWDIRKSGSTLIFSIQPAEGLLMEKRLQWDGDAYTGTMIFSIQNNTGYMIDVEEIALLWGPGKTIGKGRYNIRQAVAFNDGKITRIKPKKKAEVIPVELKNGWIGMSDQYFCALFYGDPGTFKNAVVNRREDQSIIMSVFLPEKKIAPQAKTEYVVKVYFGPQNYQDMKAVGYQINKIVNFGMFTFLSVPMYYLLKFFFKLTSNYGLAIILLTLLIRIILWWPTQKSYTSMKKMQTSMNSMQPRVKTLKEIYRDNPSKLNEETMKLYKEYKINPMGGCLPMLLQMPVFFALFATLSSAVELKGAEFFWVWTDLSAKDPVYILPILMGLSMFIQQKISTPPAATPESAAQQKMMLYMMPAMLTFFSFIWPSGLLLYWVISNILSIGQQAFINRKT
ncbi:membrane protein insertase YidC [bacterium]|nr:membrane protein insertase YidC [bacterium]